jgi:protein-disulfide isomerase
MVVPGQQQWLQRSLSLVAAWQARPVQRVVLRHQIAQDGSSACVVASMMMPALAQQQSQQQVWHRHSRSHRCLPWPQPCQLWRRRAVARAAADSVAKRSLLAISASRRVAAAVVLALAVQHGCAYMG